MLRLASGRWIVLLLLLGMVRPASPTRTLAADPQVGRKVALLAGVNTHDGTGLRNLDHAENDVQDLAPVLQRLGYTVTLLTRTEARKKDSDFFRPTAVNIRDQLAAVLKGLKQDDTVLVAFSGHGAHLKDNKLYFCPTDANTKKVDTLVSVDEVLEALKGCGAGSKLLLMDACRNDPADGRGDGTPVELQSATRPVLPEPPGRAQALFSCSKGQIAYESRTHQRGFLFHFVIEGLSGKAADKNGDVTWLGLAEYVGRELPAAVKEEKGPRADQRPELLGEARRVVLGKWSVGRAVAEGPGEGGPLVLAPGEPIKPGDPASGMVIPIPPIPLGGSHTTPRPIPLPVSGKTDTDDTTKSPEKKDLAQVRFTGPAGMKICWQRQDGKFIDEAFGLTAPKEYNFLRGRTYQLRLTQILPNFPGRSFYPKIEILTPDKAAVTFLESGTVPVGFKNSDFEDVLDGQVVVIGYVIPTPGKADQVIRFKSTITTEDARAEAAKQGLTLLALIRMGNIDLETREK